MMVLKDFHLTVIRFASNQLPLSELKTHNVKYGLVGTLCFLKRRREEEDVLLAEAVTYFNTLKTSCVKLILFSIIPSGSVIVLYTLLCKEHFFSSGDEPVFEIVIMSQMDY